MKRKIISVLLAISVVLASTIIGYAQETSIQNEMERLLYLADEIISVNPDTGEMEYKYVYEQSVSSILGHSNQPQEKAITTIVPYSVNGSQSREDWEITGGVLFFTTIYFTFIEDVGINAVDFTKATGGYTKSDRTISVISQKAVLGNTGFPYGGPGLPTSNTKTVNVSGASWTIDVSGYGWAPKYEGYGHAMGINLTFTCARSSTSWTGTLQNNYA